MQDLKFFLQQKYETSRALVIGINQYENASPLEYAVNDAKEIQEVLISELNFPQENITYLTDKDATKHNILKSYLKFTNSDIHIDDRVFIFFAGHGHTRIGYRSTVGYLVPYDGDTEDSSTLIRWDELTRNAELIRAKHLLFVMDACYGGLAVHRDSQAGGTRFLKDMYQRLSRQVITAGKENEVVSDAGGPLPNHSVFTGHLIEGIQGEAANEYGAITASGLMNYVHVKVSNDIDSNQTPHYGQFDGDGDFILLAPSLDESSDQEKGEDQFISVPLLKEEREIDSIENKISYLKDLLASPNAKIKTNDFVIREVKKFITAMDEDSFDTSKQFSDEELFKRLSSYENHTKDLAAVIATISHWCSEADLTILNKIISRSTDKLLETENGTVIWLKLRWYPILLLTYHAGIAAIENKNYKSLSTILYNQLKSSKFEPEESCFAFKLSQEIIELTRSDIFKRIPTHERNHAPQSEYLYKTIQPNLDNLFFMGTDYEASFDEFEVLYGLVVADLTEANNGSVWGPIGRFGWKYNSEHNSPFIRIINNATKLKENWPPLQAGMFGGSYERFEFIANEMRKNLNDLHWH